MQYIYRKNHAIYIEKKSCNIYIEKNHFIKKLNMWDRYPYRLSVRKNDV